MKLRKLFSTLILTTFMMLTLVITASAAVTASYSVSPKNGSTVKQGDKITVTVGLSDKYIGLKSANLTLTDANTGATIKSTDALITDTKKGNNEVVIAATIPSNCKAEGIKAKFSGKDINGTSYSKTYTFVGPVIKADPENPSDPTPTTGNVLTITADVATGSVIKSGQIITFATSSSNKSVGTKTTTVVITNNKTGAKIDSASCTATQEIGANPLKYKKTMPKEPGVYKATVTSVDIIGTKATKSFIYTIPGDGGSEIIIGKDDDIDDDDDDDDDEETYEGIINPDLDGLVIDLWLKEDTRFYELEEDDIPFVAYYYNADKKSKDKVTIEVEIPDGFKVVSKSTPYGSVKVKGDTILYTIGTVPSKEVRKVFFTLKAEDDDVCEEATNVVAVILQDDDEEDQSTQRIWVYEEDGTGSFTAYVTGYPDSTFRADNNITREETAAIMARAFNHTLVNTTKRFTDIKETSWSYRYIMACATKGIITGYPDLSFRPFNNVTRAELYAMTYRAMDIPTEEKALFVPKAYKNKDTWEKNYIAGLVRLKMMTDMKDRDAEEYASRAEVVYLVNGVQFRNPSKMMDVTYTDLERSHWCAKHIASASVTYKFKRGEGGKEEVIKK